MSTAEKVQGIQDAVWNGSIPLEIRLAPSDCRTYDQSDAYLVQYARLSYLPFLLPRLHAFFRRSMIDARVVPFDGWFSFENVPLKWQYPLGLLFDLFSGSSPHQAGKPALGHGAGANPDDSDERKEPWLLIVHFTDWPEDVLVRPDTEGRMLHDAFINSVKEADFLRNGTAKGIMSLSKEDSTKLWNAVKEHDGSVFTPIFKRLLHAQGAPLRHIPLKIYLPSSPTSSQPKHGHLKVVQSLVTPQAAGTREARTLGAVLHDVLPTLFPSRRTHVVARPVLHGAVIPMSAPIEDLMKVAAYLDGWLHIGLAMID